MNEPVVGRIGPEEQWIGAATEPPRRRNSAGRRPLLSEWGRGFAWGVVLATIGLGVSLRIFG